VPGQIAARCRAESATLKVDTALVQCDEDYAFVRFFELGIRPGLCGADRNEGAAHREAARNRLDARENRDAQI
jgi:hypothetical protein